MNLTPMTVRTKLSLTFGGLSVLVLFVAGLAMKSLAEEHDQFVDYVHGVNARAQAAADVRAAVDRRAIAARNLVLVRKAEDLAAEQNSVVAAHEAVQANLGTLNQLVTRAADLPETARSLVAEMNRIEAAYGLVALEIVRLAAAGQHDAAIARMNADCRPLLAALVKASDDYRDYTLSKSLDRAAHRLREALINPLRDRDSADSGR